MTHLSLMLMLLFTGCQISTTTYTYEPPPDINDGLNTGSLEAVDMDPGKITKAIDKIASGRFNEVHSMLIFKNGLLVVENYFDGYRYQWDAPKYHGEYVHWNRDMLHSIMSCSKSFTSACIGIAIDKGYIQSVHDKIFEYLPDHQMYRTGGKENITIEHLLTMTSGLDWNEWSAAHGTSANDIDRLYFDCSDDPIKCVLERDLIHPPGEFFTYNGGGVVMLGEILKNATTKDIGEFSKEYLFDPLGIDSVGWYQFNNGVFATDGSMYLTPRDMLKFGMSYLQKGSWNGEQVLTTEWTEKSAEAYNHNHDIKIPIEDSGKNSYGYLWWISQLQYKGGKTKMYRANGWGGQSIMVFPDLDMVVVFTSGNYAAKSRLFKIVEHFVLPSIN